MYSITTCTKTLSALNWTAKKVIFLFFSVLCSLNNVSLLCEKITRFVFSVVGNFVIICKCPWRQLIFKLKYKLACFDHSSIVVEFIFMILFQLTIFFPSFYFCLCMYLFVWFIYSFIIFTWINQIVVHLLYF